MPNPAPSPVDSVNTDHVLRSSRARATPARSTRTTADNEMLVLCKQRINLFAELGPTLRNPSPKNPKRAAINRQRTATRKRVRTDLEDNGQAIIARVMTLFAAELGAVVL